MTLGDDWRGATLTAGNLVFLLWSVSNDYRV
ncbi:hypothetical protein EMIT0P171_120224 [Pseudomonas sp. IT-P171]